MLLAIFTSIAYMLTGITGEKQLRVTESITVIITPQAWIDGKMLGICAYTLATIANMVVGGVLLAFVAKLAWGFSLPAVIVRPSVLLVLVVYAILGLLLWNAFFGAFAATIDDPNTSTRTSVMFLPMIPVAMTLTVMRIRIISRRASFPCSRSPVRRRCRCASSCRMRLCWRSWCR